MNIATTNDNKTPEQVVRSLLDAMCRFSIGDTSALIDIDALYADPTHVVHPMRPDLPALRTREDALHHFDTIGRQFSSTPQSRRAVDIAVHQTLDPGVVITEFTYETVVDGQTLYTPCIWVTTVRDGRIIAARDYNGEPTRRPPEHRD